MGNHAHTSEVSGPRQNNLLVCPMKNVRYWLHMYKLTTDGNYIKTFAGHFRNRDEKEK